MAGQISLSTVANGAIEERINIALQEIVNNIVDPNTDYKKKRKLSITMTFTPREDRDFTSVAFDVKPTLAPQKTVETGLLIDFDGNGEAVAAEYRKQAPGQTYIDDNSNIRNLSNAK